MKCASCGKMFSLHQLRFIPDGVVSGTHGMKKHKAQCNKCIKKIPIDRTTK